MKRTCNTGTIAQLSSPKKQTPKTTTAFVYGFCSRTPEGKNKYYEHDYGEKACKKLAQKIFRYFRDWSRRHGLPKPEYPTVYGRKPGWIPKSADSWRQWRADGYRNRRKYYDWVDGLGRYHAHGALLFGSDSGITEKQRRELKAHIAVICGCEFTQRKNIYLQPMRDAERYAIYMQSNIDKTVKLGNERLRGGSRRVKPAVPVVEVPAQAQPEAQISIIPAGSGSYSFYVPLVDCGASEVNGRSLVQSCCHSPP